MAKIEEKITYKGKICKYKNTIDDMMFYSYYEDEKEEDEVLLLVNKNSKEVLAKITANLGYGAYGLYWNGFIVEKE